MQRRSRFDRAIAEIDRANRDDPRTEWFDGAPVPRELAYARRMTRWLEALYPDASEALRLAARAQHVRRWEIPRADYPEGRDGYIRWRTHLKRHHARVAGEILERAGYEAETIGRVQDLLRKKGVKSDPETQALEDVACLVFLENAFADFADKHDPEKIVAILQKTWRKMSPTGQAAALNLDMPPSARELVERAVSEAA